MSLMSGAPGNLEDISENSGHAFAMEMGLLEFCITQLENELTDNNQDIEYLNDVELEVCCFLLGKSQN